MMGLMGKAQKKLFKKKHFGPFSSPCTLYWNQQMLEVHVWKKLCVLRKSHILVMNHMYS
jgi:hypothetical protein